ncbi:hypothetical protein A5785_02455 [Gordonia sp. 852002-50395_SCH5434458]|nr:hypothetical protein A5785_02455 [Gordonia sp. 852002-50395_SCH5434458]
MRALDEVAMQRQAQRNPSIVLEDTHLNTAYVNDGRGGLRELTSDEGVEPVLAYGDARIDAVKRKWNPQSFETTTIVAWVPKDLLKEVPDYYPVYRTDKKSGEQVKVGSRSRWVMPDNEAGRAKVEAWFRETHAHLTQDVLTGGHNSVHGVVWNHDESAVHVHWMVDTLAPVSKDLSVGPDRVMLDADGRPVVKYKKSVTLDKVVAIDKRSDTLRDAPEISAADIAGIDRYGYLLGEDGQRLQRTTGEPVRASEDLRVEAQQMWGQSAEVTKEVDGKLIKPTGATKMRDYQEAYRRRIHALGQELGFEVKLEVNPEGASLDKSAFVHLETERIAAETEAEAQRAALEQERLELVAAKVAGEAELATARVELEQTVAEIEAAKANLTADWEKTEKPKLIAAATKEAKKEASKIEDEARSRGYSDGYATGEAAVAQQRQQLTASLAAQQKALAEAKAAREKAAEERSYAAAEGFGAGKAQALEQNKVILDRELARLAEAREQYKLAAELGTRALRLARALPQDQRTVHVNRAMVDYLKFIGENQRPGSGADGGPGPSGAGSGVQASAETDGPNFD